MTLERKGLYANNNFDLIRLIAAAQVVLIHAVDDLHVRSLAGVASVLEYFPGVPAFFFISGYLIKAAWDRNPAIRVFYLNRAYRILPALWASVILATITLVIFYDRGLLIANARLLLLWIVGQATIGQVWTPAFLRSYGLGAVNGSLWTIPVELSFYAIVPAMAWLLAKRIKPSHLLPILIVLSFSLNYALPLWAPTSSRTVLIQKLIMASPLPWLGMFFVGMLVQANIDKVYPLIAGRVWTFVALFIGISVLSALKPIYPLISGPDQVEGGGNRIGIANYLALCCLVVSGAYSYRSLSDRVLRRNDLSYGIYIAHGIVINVLVQNQLFGTSGFALALTITVALAAISWHWLEKPMLARRKASLYQR